MAGGVMCGDLPYEDKENFKKFMIEINYDMTEQNTYYSYKCYKQY